MGITDGTFVCELCGEWQTACSLCGTAPLVDMSSTLATEEKQRKDDEYELRQQENSIRKAAEARRVSF